MLHLGAVGAQGNCHHGASPSALRFSGGRAPLVAGALLARSLAAPAHSASLAEYSGRSSACRSTGRSDRSSPASTRASSGRSSPPSQCIRVRELPEEWSVRRLLRELPEERSSGRSNCSPPSTVRELPGERSQFAGFYASCRRSGRSSPSTVCELPEERSQFAFYRRELGEGRGCNKNTKTTTNRCPSAPLLPRRARRQPLRALARSAIMPKPCIYQYEYLCSH